MKPALLSSMRRAHWTVSTEDSTGGPPELPADYVSVIASIGAGEGFVGSEFIRLFPPKDLASLNVSYEIAAYVPGLLLFGSNGGGEAYCYDLRDASAPVVRLPFATLDWRYLERIATSLTELLIGFCGSETSHARVPNPELRGMEIFETHPIALGGSPDDPKNKALLTRDQHIEAVRFWNRVFAKVKA